MKKLLCMILSLTIVMSAFSFMAFAEEMSMPSSWAEDEIDRAMQKGIITDAVCEDFQADITREEFCELIMLSFEKLNKEEIETAGISFTDTENESVLKAASVGIVNGYGEGIFAPDDKITREQIATMLVRMLDKANIGLDVTDYEKIDFTDAESISDWALPSLNFVYSSAIMVGAAPQRADAQDYVTCEMGILLAYRTYDRFAFYGRQTLGEILAEDFLNKATDEAAALSIAEELMKNEAIKFAPVVQNYEDEFLMGFGSEEVKGYKEAAVFSPAIGTIPFIGYIFTLEEGTDAEEFKVELEKKSKLNWNICTTADQRMVSAKGNKVFFVMCPYEIEG